MRKTVVVLLALWFSALSIQAQDDLYLDMSFEDFMELVDQHHPLARQADNQLNIGDKEVQKSKGAFDPKLFAENSQKYFDQSQYYSRFDGGLKIPTWFGVEVEAAYNVNIGDYVNPQDFTLDAGLWYAGVSAPIGQDLFIDERRAALRKAEVFQQAMVAEQRLMLSDLLYNAGQAYWNWFQAYHTTLVYEDAIELAEERFEFTKQSASIGERPYIDTLEAGIQVQNRRIGLQKAQVDLENAKAFVEVYLWEEAFIPLELAQNVIPTPISENQPRFEGLAYERELDSLIARHPKMSQYNLKIDGLEVDERLNKERLKPELDLVYKAINEPVGGNPLAEYSTENYIWGVRFQMPILLRKERAELDITRLKIENMELDQSNVSMNLRYKAEASINTWEMSLSQVRIYEQTVEDYSNLLNGERRLFETGESSVFMVNRRELGYINAKIKLIEYLTKNHKAKLSTEYSLGLLWE